jgi:hypothetical protein
MPRLLKVSAIVLMALAIPAGADEKKEEGAKAAPLERLKKLEGTWVSADKEGKPTEQVVSIFKITAGGSAIHETIFPGTPHEMVTLYHQDGKEVMLTHYCAAGNQPRMKLDPQSPADELQFKFAGGSNLDPAKDMHMHEGSIKFLGPDRIEWQWQGYHDGKPAEEHKVKLTLIRKAK